jgi:hypothetical protein
MAASRLTEGRGDGLATPPHDWRSAPELAINPLNPSNDHADTQGIVLRLLRGLSVLLLIVAGFTVAPTAPARVDTPRFDGRFTLNVRVVKAINVSGRHVGQRFTRTLTFGRT